MSNFNQWPSISFFKFKKKNRLPSEIQINEIEKFFSFTYKSKYAALTPSGRSAINLILSYNKFDRSKLVNIPKWSSSCLYYAIGSITNVTIQNYFSDCLIVVHKWGHTFKQKKKKTNQIIIDDSADTIPDKNYIPFVNGGKYEVISIPKIIGSFSGGIVLTNDKKFYEFCKVKQFVNLELGKIQSFKKYNSFFNKKKHPDWMCSEVFNTSLESNMIENILDNLENFEKNKKIILKRKKIMRELSKNFYNDEYRLGPCVIIKKKKNFKFFAERHFSYTKKADRELYEKSFIIPIHFSVKDKNFDRMVEYLSKLK